MAANPLGDGLGGSQDRNGVLVDEFSDFLFLLTLYFVLHVGTLGQQVVGALGRAEFL